MARLDLGKVVPEKGVDYYTAEEILDISEDITEQVETDIAPTLASNLQTAKDYTDNQNANDIKNVEYNSTTGVLIFTKHDNTTITVDLPVEEIVTRGYYDSLSQDLVLVLASGQEIRIPASGLIDDYTGTTSATIQVVVSNDNKITCNIVSGSISKTLLTTELQNEINSKANASDVYNKVDSDNRYLQNSKIVILTQAEYDALETKDATVYYLIKEV